MNKQERLEQLLREARHLLLCPTKVNTGHAWFNEVSMELGEAAGVKEGGVIVREGNIARDGSCNFCTQRPPKTAKVWVLNGKTLEVRLCPDCMAILKKAT